MKIKALVPFSNGNISMEQYEVREVTDALGNQLIAAGVAIEIGGGGTGGGVLVVTITTDDETGAMTFDKTWQECADADIISIHMNGENGETTYMLVSNISRIEQVPSGELCSVTGLVWGNDGFAPADFETDSASGYPSFTPGGV